MIKSEDTVRLAVLALQLGVTIHNHLE